MPDKEKRDTELPQLVELQIPITMNDILKKWSHQAGKFDDGVSKDIREKTYLDALMAVFSMFARHHDELSDGDFVRAFRFFKDAGFTKRLSVEASAAERYAKLEYQEPGFEKPKKEEEMISAKTLEMMDASVKNLAAGIVGAPIDTESLKKDLDEESGEETVIQTPDPQ